MMKPAVFIGVVLIVLSIFSFAYQGITYTTREKVIDIGPIEATAEKQKTIPLPPVFGAIALIGGIALVIPVIKVKRANPVYELVFPPPHWH